MSECDIVERLRAGICQDRCRAMEARAGCECAEAADTIERQAAEIERLRGWLRRIRTHPASHKCVSVLDLKLFATTALEGERQP